MKKLMTMIAAVAAAFGLYADGIATGTGFEDSTGGSLVTVVEDIDELTDAKELQEAYWDLSALSETVTATVTAYGDDDGYTGDAPSQFGVDGIGIYYLALKTGSSEVKRYYSDSKAAFSLSKNAPKIFFDSVVKFTAFDSDPTIDDNAKAAVWLQEVINESTQEPTATNLYVKVGGVTYDCGGSYSALADAWARVTIKAMTIDKSDAVLGFMVFVEQKAVATDDDVDFTGITLKPELKAFADAGKLFPAAGKAAEITSVGFQGQGSIDTIVFTDTAPDFAPDPQAYEIAWDTAHMTDVVISTNGQVIAYTAVPVIVPGALPEGGVTFTWKGTAGKASGTKTIETATDKAFTITEAMLDDAEAEFNEVPWTLEKALELVEDATDPATLKLLISVDELALMNTVKITLDLGVCTVASAEVAGDLEITGSGTITGSFACSGDLPVVVGADVKFGTDDINDYLGANQIAVEVSSGCWMVKDAVNVTFDLQGYGEAIKAQKIVKGAKATKPADPVDETKVFGGWFAEATYENEFDFDAAVNVDTTVYAKWDDPAPSTLPFTITIAENVSEVIYKVNNGASVSVTATAEQPELYPNDVVEVVDVCYVIGYYAAETGNKKGGKVTVVDTAIDWTFAAKQVSAEDLPDDVTAAEAGITNQAFMNAEPAEVKQVVKWNTTHTGANINEAVFVGNVAQNAQADAYLLDCAPAEVETVKKTFKFDAIVPGTVPAIGEDGKFGNGNVLIFGATEIGAETEWHTATSADLFYKAQLVK